MKIFKIITILLMVFFIGGFKISAQENKQKEKVEQSSIENLSKDQLLLLDKQKELIKANRAKFKAGLTDKQLEILANQKMSKQERQKMLMSTFTKSQQLMLQEHRLSVQEMKNRFRMTLTDEQRQTIRARLRIHKDTQDGNELRETVRDTRRHKKRRTN